MGLCSTTRGGPKNLVKALPLAAAGSFISLGALLTEASEEFACARSDCPRNTISRDGCDGGQTATHVTHNARTRMLHCGVWP